MISIFFYSFLTIFILFFLGYGLTSFFVPKQLQPYAFWLSPWSAILFLIFSLVIFSLAGLSTSQLVIPIGIGLGFCNIIAFIRKRKYFPLNLKEDIIIWLFVIGSLIFNLSPLIFQHKSLTSISLGNNDIIMYANVPDYLTNHSIFEGLFSNSSLAVNHVLKESYRWGPPILSSFFLSLFNLEGYQFAYIFSVIIFSLIIPLIYIFLKMIYRPSLSGLRLSLILTIFNVNLLYILYHVFFAQVLYWGLTLCFYIYIYSYVEENSGYETHNINSYDIVISVLLSVIYLTFYEGMIFIFFPILVFLLLKFLFHKELKYYYLKLSKIFFLFLIISSISIINSALYDINLVFGKEGTGPIGWQLFRYNNQFPNPLEIIGLYSIHSYEALNLFAGILLSIIVIVIILYGTKKSKNPLLISSFLIVFLVFYFWTGIIRHHFFYYYRAVTFSLPLLIILFSIGVTHSLRRNKLLLISTVIIFTSLVLFFALKLNKRLLNEHFVVDKTFISIKDIPPAIYKTEPIFSEYRLNNVITSVWKNNWTEYFLYKDKPSAIPPQAASQFENSIPDDSLILMSKLSSHQASTNVLLKSPIVWENPYYLLGRLCNSAQCLLNRPEDLSRVTPGKDSFEDSLLISGWSAKETTNRWATGNESTLRLASKDSRYRQLTFEAQALSEPQTVTVYFDGKLLGTQEISTQWSQYVFSIAEGIPRGVHQIRFTYAHTYKPSEVLKNQDMRDLAVNFRWIGIQ